jgi:hypothetical protein
LTVDRDQRRLDRRLIAEVRSRVWQWDPIGLAEMGAPEDEYECIVGPISAALRRGVSAAELAGTLDAQVSDHFGADATGSKAVAEGLVVWRSTQCVGG